MTSADSFDIFLSDYANVSRYLSTELSALLTTYHLTLDAFLIMHEIGKSQAPLLLMDIAHRHHVSRSAISRQISALLSYGYVQQQPMPVTAVRKVSSSPTVVARSTNSWSQRCVRARINGLIYWDHSAWPRCSAFLKTSTTRSSIRPRPNNQISQLKRCPLTRNKVSGHRLVVVD